MFILTIIGHLAGTQLNDQALQSIGQMTNLRKLRLEQNQISETAVTEQGVQSLKQKIPGLEITGDIAPFVPAVKRK